MTPLERAKAFMHSRAAKTALKIMPLALAAVVSLSGKAQATSTAQLSGSFEKWTVQSCSGGPCLDLATLSSSWSYGADGSVTGSGSASGVHGGGTGTTMIIFQVSGGGTGNYGSLTDFLGNFTIGCIGLTGGSCDPHDTFSVNITATVDNLTGSASSAVTPGSYIVTGSFLTTDGDSVAANPWSAEIDFFWNGIDGEQLSLNPTNLGFDPHTPVSTTPEPASMLLALSGLPFLARLRKKR